MNCTQLVTILDIQNPIPTVCPADVTIENDLGMCGAVHTYPYPEATDNCAIVQIEITEGLLSGEFFPLGDTYVEYLITDVNGNDTICGFTVTVIDTEAPILEAPVNITYVQVEGECESVVTFEIPVGTDNCPGALTIQTDNTGLTTGDIFPVGVTSLCYLSTDASGNQTPLCFDVVVLDTEAPVVLQCPGDVDVDADQGICGAALTMAQPIATDNCGYVSMFDDAPNILPVGNTLVTWVITDQSANTQQCQFTVTVHDIETPVITCPDDVIVVAEWGACQDTVAVDTPVVMDNCAIETVWNDFNNSADASGVYPLGITTVNWMVVDVNGNSSTCSMTVDVQTAGPPVVDCPEDISVEATIGECGADIVVPAMVFQYECSILEVMNDYTGSDDASAFYPVGTTVVTWTVTDVSMNVVQCNMIVTVTDLQLPTISCPENIQLSNDIGFCGAVVNYDLPMVTDNCEIQSLVMTEGLPSGEIFPVGMTSVSFLVSDVNGNAVSCAFQVLVTDDEAPVIDCPENIISESDTVFYPYPEFTDNCYAELMLLEGQDVGTVFEHGHTYVLYAAMDLSGNMDTCGFDILVNRPPIAVNDTVIIFESDDVIDVSALLNDSDPDGDAFSLVEIIYGGNLGTIEGDHILFDIPDNECGIDSVIYVIMDQYGATDTATVYVQVDCNPTVFVPEGFSPNGDGVNDVLHILGLLEYPQNELFIFNRWGHKVFERKDYKNDWDGRSEAAMTIGETLLPRGTYYYVLDLHNSKIKPMKGFIYINPR